MQEGSTSFRGVERGVAPWAFVYCSPGSLISERQQRKHLICPPQARRFGRIDARLRLFLATLSLRMRQEWTCRFTARHRFAPCQRLLSTAASKLERYCRGLFAPLFSQYAQEYCSNSQASPAPRALFLRKTETPMKSSSPLTAQDYHGQKQQLPFPFPFISTLFLWSVSVSPHDQLTLFLPVQTEHTVDHSLPAVCTRKRGVPQAIAPRDF